MNDRGISIWGVSPQDYAAMWGSESEDGALFCNYSSENQVKDDAWYGQFIGAIRRQLREVWQHPDKFEPGDEMCLAVLLAVVECERAGL
jgi:hypothetical protein